MNIEDFSAEGIFTPLLPLPSLSQLLPGVAYFDLWETNTAAAIRHVTEHMRADQETDALMRVLISLMYLAEG